MKVKNIVFDIGNVLVRWAPHEVISNIFPGQDPKVFFNSMRHIWLDLNLGKISETKAINLYHNNLKIPKEKLVQLMAGLKTSQVPIEGSLELLEQLYQAKIPLYSITDNIREIMEYHRTYSGFLDKFKGVVVSADVGVLKPDPAIYKHLLTLYNLNPAETIFIDDVIANVRGAEHVGMHSFQFLNAKQCQLKLNEFGIYI